MFYLLLAIICSGLIAIIFKVSEGKKSNRYAINTFNYTIATTISFLLIKDTPIFHLSWFKDFFTEFIPVIKDFSYFSPNASRGYAILIGILTGIIYYLGFYLYQVNVNKNGSSLSATFMKLGIIIPSTLSMIFFKETPTVFQIIGLLLAVFGIIAINLSLEKNVMNKIKYDLILLFVVGGLGDFNSKLYAQYGLSTYESLFIFYIFSTAFVISIVMLIIKNKKVSLKDITLGLLVGIPNQLTSVFLLKSLSIAKASIIFPSFSVGTILFVNGISLILFKEKMKKPQFFAMIIIIISLIFINL